MTVFHLSFGLIFLKNIMLLSSDYILNLTA